MLSGEELAGVVRFLSMARTNREHLLAYENEYPAFSSPARKLRDFSPEIEALGVVDDAGRLYDSASPALAKIRGEIDGLKRQIRRSAQGIIDNPSLGHMLQERVSAFRNGHFVFLVRQEFINRFPGTVVDRSSSGNSVYMEPSSLVPLNNRLAVAEREEREEEHTIYRALTRTLLERERLFSTPRRSWLTSTSSTEPAKSWPGINGRSPCGPKRPCSISGRPVTPSWGIRRYR
ncbi:hypothetical protein MASR2M79_18490 [Aminivibrio sp.]